VRQPLTILKFGGSVLRGEADLPAAVSEITRWTSHGPVIAVVSAFEGTTDALLARAHRLCADPPTDAGALLLSTGEFTTAALLAMALHHAGVPARALNPGAIALRTRGQGCDADPRSVDERRIRAALARAPVAVVPGFIGEDDHGSYTLLGRGGSDLTALFLAATLDAARCRLVKDVDGLFERDPALPGPPPGRFLRISWDRALQLDGGVVQHKAVRLARTLQLAFEVGSMGSRHPTIVGPGPSTLDTPAASEEVEHAA
jgi:homoserine dehydrogenase